MKNFIRTLLLFLVLGGRSQAQPLTIGDWQQLKPPAFGGTAWIDEIYKGRIYALNEYQGYSSTNQGLSWEQYNNNPYYASSVRIKKIGGRLLSFGSRAIILKDYGTETWADTFVYMFSNNNVWTDQIQALIPHKDSVLAIGRSRSNLSMDTLYILKADTLTWNFKQIAINVPHKLILTSSYSLNTTTKGDSIFMSYGVVNPNFSSTFFTTMSSDGGRNWKTVCMGSEYSLTLQGNSLYTINKVAGDSLAVFRRNLPDTSITVLKAGMTRKSFPLDVYNTKLYTHKNKVYMNGLDGVFYLNGLAWQKLGIWPPNLPWNVLQLYFEGDTIWATTSRGLFRYTPQSPMWELRGNGLVNERAIKMQSLKDNRVFCQISEDYKNVYSLSTDNGQTSSIALETPELYFFSYSLAANNTIVGYDDRIRRSTNNGILWEESNTALPANQKSYGMVSKGNYLFLSLGENGVVYRSDDDGVTWQIKNNGKPMGFLNNSNELFSVNDVLYQYRGGALYRSADDAESWTKCNFNNSYYFTRSGPAHYGNEIFVPIGNDTNYFHSPDNGLTWTKKAMPAYIGNIVFNIGDELFFMKQEAINKIYRYTGDINNTVYVADFPQTFWLNKIAHNDSLLFISDGTNNAKVYYAPYQTLLPTSVKENANRSIAVRMYPNPAREAVTLELPANVTQAQISILDVLGKELMQTSSTESKVNVSLRGLSAGVYFVRIQTPQGSSTKRLLVQE